MGSTGLERKAHRLLGSKHPGQSRGMDIARTILATSLDRRKADRATVKMRGSQCSSMEMARPQATP
jgi:hypothetical protein